MPVGCLRVPPEIVRLPPALMPLRQVWVEFWHVALIVFLVGVVGLAVVIAVYVSLAGGFGPAWSAGLVRVFVAPVVVVSVLPLVALPLLLWVRFVGNRAARRWHAAHPQVMADARAAVYLREFASAGWADYRSLANALRAVSSNPPRCRIACVADVQPPATPDTLIEPVVIKPGQVIGPWLASAAGLGALVLFVLVRTARVAPATGLAALGLLLLAAWTWLCALRPRYIRFAPGLIEVLRYRPFGGPPEVVRLPVDADTVIFVGSQGPHPAQTPGKSLAGSAGWDLVVCRPERIQKLRFQGSREVTERIWHALLSTAPTPPLTYDTL